jgi:hypothetical protein
MKQITLIILTTLLSLNSISAQQREQGKSQLLFQGLAMDAKTEAPVPDAQIFINRTFRSVSDPAGKFAFYAERHDTIVFRILGYTDSRIIVSDTLAGTDFITGVYLHPDTIEIPEVVIIPRLQKLKSELFSPKQPANREFENAKYNMALTSYQAKVNESKLGTPEAYYDVIRQRQKDAAYTRGQIPSDRIVGLSPLSIIPLAYMLLHGPPQRPEAPKPYLTEQEVNEIHKRYLRQQKK